MNLGRSVTLRLLGMMALGLLQMGGCSKGSHTRVASIGLSPSTLSFSVSEGGADPPSQTVTLTNSGDAGTTLEWTATSDQPWLQVTPSSGTQGTTGSTSLVVSVNATTQVEAWTGPTSTVGAPTAGTNVTAGWGVWTGSAMLVWNGDGTTPGKFYDPVTDTWSGSTSTVGAPSGRTSFTAVWTGTEMIVWGGHTIDGSFVALNTGGRYSPATNTWASMSTAGAPSARAAHRGVWTGTHMIVWGGDGLGYTYTNTGGIYDPATDAWIGATTTVGAPPARGSHAAVWTGTHLLIWGGENPGKFNTGYFYDPDTDTWTGTTTTTGAPTARSHMPGIWTGREMIIWGGSAGAGSDLDTGARYNPATDAWTGGTPLTGAPEARSAHMMVWTGRQMTAWGGVNNVTSLSTGTLYLPPIPAEGPHTGGITVSAPGVDSRTVTVSLTVDP